MARVIIRTELTSTQQARRCFLTTLTEQGHFFLQNKAPKYKIINIWLVPSFPTVSRLASSVSAKQNYLMFPLRLIGRAELSGDWVQVTALPDCLWDLGQAHHLCPLLFTMVVYYALLSSIEFYFIVFNQYWNVPLWAIYSSFCLLQNYFPGFYMDFLQQWTRPHCLYFSSIPMSPQIMANTINCRFHCYRDT